MCDEKEQEDSFANGKEKGFKMHVSLQHYIAYLANGCLYFRKRTQGCSGLALSI